MEGLERWQNNQVKKMGIGRLGLIFFMIGGMLFVVLRSGQTTYLVIQVVLLFSALFFGYRFGPGAGAIAGSISGIMLSLVSGEAAHIVSSWNFLRCISQFRQDGQRDSMCSGSFWRWNCIFSGYFISDDGVCFGSWCCIFIAS
mgnify:CR=1 FL=1